MDGKHVHAIDTCDKVIRYMSDAEEEDKALFALRTSIRKWSKNWA